MSCSICFEERNFNAAEIILTCGHRFHFNCMIGWIDKSSTCPLCRKPQDIKINTPEKIFNDLRIAPTNEMADRAGITKNLDLLRFLIEKYGVSLTPTCLEKFMFSDILGHPEQEWIQHIHELVKTFSAPISSRCIYFAMIKESRELLYLFKQYGAKLLPSDLKFIFTTCTNNELILLCLDLFDTN